LVSIFVLTLLGLQFSTLTIWDCICSLFKKGIVVDVWLDPDLVFYGTKQLFSASDDVGACHGIVVEPGDVFSDICLDLPGVFGGAVMACHELAGSVSVACDVTGVQLGKAVVELADVTDQYARDISAVVVAVC
jgi:hypothetical protein